MKISILTLFPEMFRGPFSQSIIKQAIGKQAATINFINIRDFGLGKHQVVDDTPYGGGIGMVMRVDVLKSALDATRDKNVKAHEEKVILMTADGTSYNQRLAESYTKIKHLIIICGHYEGIDERIRTFVDEEISIGDFVLTGGEIPAMLIVDSVIRLLPGVLKPGVTSAESFSHKKDESYLLEYPLYTKPQSFENMDVPDVLLSGNHKKIAEWREAQTLKRTAARRPDLIKDQYR